MQRYTQKRMIKINAEMSNIFKLKNTSKLSVALYLSTSNGSLPSLPDDEAS